MEFLQLVDRSMTLRSLMQLISSLKHRLFPLNSLLQLVLDGIWLFKREEHAFLDLLRLIPSTELVVTDVLPSWSAFVIPWSISYTDFLPFHPRLLDLRGFS